MSSVNPYFTMNYSQPNEYHFSHDSVFLARKGYEYLKNQNLRPSAVLDLCAGCGIVGMDLLIHFARNQLSFPKSIDFLEVQTVYQNYFYSNLLDLRREINTSLEVNLILLNYADLPRTPAFKKKYAFIICNPPFFHVGNGKLSPSDFKNRCRFFIDSDLKSLIAGVNYSLKPAGSALVLLKSMDHHGIDVESLVRQESKLSANGLTVQKIDSVRGTDLFELAKPLGL